MFPVFYQSENRKRGSKRERESTLLLYLLLASPAAEHQSCTEVFKIHWKCQINYSGHGRAEPLWQRCPWCFHSLVGETRCCINKVGFKRLPEKKKAPTILGSKLAANRSSVICYEQYSLIMFDFFSSKPHQFLIIKALRQDQALCESVTCSHL